MNRKVPVQFTTIIYLTALAASLIMSGWYRQFILLFGSHIKSIVTIIAEGFICLSLGTWIFGHLADRVRHIPLVWLIPASATTLYIFFQNRLFHLISDHIRPESTAYVILPLIIMFIPLALISGTLPLLVKYFIKSLNQAGLFMSTTLFAIAAGVVTAILLAVLLIVPSFGIPALFISAGIFLLAAQALMLVSIKESTEKKRAAAQVTKQTTVTPPIKFRKKRIVLETGVKLTRAMLYGSVFQAFSFSSLLILYFRILINYNHLNPVFFYSAVLLVVFTGLAAGSTLYNVIADRPANKYLTLAILQIIAGISSLLSFAVQQMLAPDIFINIPGNPSFSELAFLHILLISLLVFIPSVIHGMSLPLAGRLYPKRLHHIGKTFGRLSSLVFISLLSGIAFTPLILIPLIGINPSYVFLSMLILLSGVYLIIRDSRLIRGFRFAFASGALAVFIILIVVLRMLNISQRNRATDGIYEGSTASVRFLYNPDSTKSVYINGAYSFGTDEKSIREQLLSVYIPLVLNPGINSALVIGFNTGISASVLNEQGVSEIQITEISPELIRLSSATFSDANNDILTQGVVNVLVTDPRPFLLRTEDSFDIILSGSEQLVLYPGRFTRDYFRICYDKLSENGLYCQALPLNTTDSTVINAIYNTCAEIYDHTSLWYLAPGRVLMIGAKMDYTSEYCLLSKKIEGNLRQLLLQTGINDPESFLARFILGGNPFKERNLPENSDLYPELEFSNTHINEFFLDSSDYIMKYAEPEKAFFLSDSCQINKEIVLERIKRISQLMQQDASPF